MYGRRLTAQQKDERGQETVTGNDLRVTTRAIYFARCRTRERIGRGQHGVVSPALGASPFRTFRVLRVRHLMRMRIPSYMYDYVMCDLLNYTYR